jgi:formate--tetrahydrofolate ligase
MKSDIEITREYELAPIARIAAKLGVPAEALQPYGQVIAKIDAKYLASLRGKPEGKLILVTAITPTPAGEGKTTTTVGLGDGLTRIGKRAAICLREPSLGPCFGMKGGAAGGGRAQVAPMEDINLHFTGDIHAITAAHNLLAAMLDNHIHWGNALDIDARRVSWRRAIDMNDRALREMVIGLGGPGNGFSRQDGYDITVASEVMATFCLSETIEELEEKLSRMIVAYTRGRKPVTAGDLKAAGAMSALLLRALQPNLVQSLEGTPALIHGGPFANIAHGCNSVAATKAALRMADYVVTEAGFGADLGAEKFFNIKCRQAGLKPAAAVVVATARALKMHGGAARSELNRENLAALEAGLANLERHIQNVRKFHVDALVAVNHFDSDSPAEIELIRRFVEQKCGAEAIVNDSWRLGAAGAEALARTVVDLADRSKLEFQPLYPDDMPLIEKTRVIVREIYRGKDIADDPSVVKRFEELEQAGFGRLPICVAKTQYSFSDDPKRLGAPSGHIAEVHDIRVRAGAGFVVVFMGEITAMPGLPRVPAAENIRVVDGRIEGLF